MQHTIAPEKDTLTIGYMSLLDSAPLIWAHYRGFFAQQGLDVTLVKEVSWASLRDRLAYNALDAAQCLAPMITAANLGADHVHVPFISALTLSENWAAISLSHTLANELAIDSTLSPLASALKLKQYLDSGHSLILAHVFPYSLHHYLLREWLSLADINEQTADISFITVPPSHMVSKLEHGMIDGFCVGEPWNTVAMTSGIGHPIGTAHAIMPYGADKVLGVTAEWAQQHPHAHQAMVMALMQAQYELTQLTNYDELIEVLKQYQVVDLPKPLLTAALEGKSAGNSIRFVSGIDAMPKPLDYAGLGLQMLRWKQWQQPTAIEALSQQCCDHACFGNAYHHLTGHTLDPQYIATQQLSRQQASDYLADKGWDSEHIAQILTA